MLIPLDTLIAFALIALGLVLTPGPNMIYLISRSLSQGWQAGAVSLAGTLLGFVFYALAAALGLTAIALAVPYAYETIKYAGAAYLLWLAWQTLKPGGASPFVTQKLSRASAWKLFTMGFVTNLLNPKIALFYLALLPQFVDPERGMVFLQHMIFAGTQIVISAIGNLAFILTAGGIASFLARRPIWLAVQRYLMGFVLVGLALRLALDRK
jgi:threonine/homoserine/homoserine lactone efflux protein